MSADWLDPIRSALDLRDAPAAIFFRDDDTGWNDERLNALLDCFSRKNMPIDLAVIPQAAGPNLAESLLNRWQHDRSVLGLHQHGYAHANHESTGRKCEFGSSRRCEEQHRDILAGQQRLADLFGPALDPIFTPPWNRCTDTTSHCLVSLGFRALSRDRTASPLNRGDLTELPVHVDWCGIRRRVADPWRELAISIGDELYGHHAQPLGIMLHHTVMDPDDLERLEALLGLFSESINVHSRLMRECLSMKAAQS